MTPKPSGSRLSSSRVGFACSLISAVLLSISLILICEKGQFRSLFGRLEGVHRVRNDSPSEQATSTSFLTDSAEAGADDIWPRGIGELNELEWGGGGKGRGGVDRKLIGGKGDFKLPARKARIAYLILSNGMDAGKLQFLLPEIYHPDNFYIVHVDNKAPKEQADKIRTLVNMLYKGRDGRPPHGRMLEPAVTVTWGGFSLTLACLYGIATALQWSDEWDYFINISSSDFPIMSQADMGQLILMYDALYQKQTGWLNLAVTQEFILLGNGHGLMMGWWYNPNPKPPLVQSLPTVNVSLTPTPTYAYQLYGVASFQGMFLDRGTNFMDGSLLRGFEKRWKGMVDDQGLFRAPGEQTQGAMYLLSMQRPRPQRFNMFKGEFWVVLHRSFCSYITLSPDNVARSLMAYFSGTRVSDESYFQTTACHPEAQDFTIHNDCLRYTSWNEDHWENGRRVDKHGNILLHPQDITVDGIKQIQESGSLFARKFGIANSRPAYAVLHASIRNTTLSAQRRATTLHRLGEGGAFSVSGRSNFCNVTRLPSGEGGIRH